MSSTSLLSPIKPNSYFQPFLSCPFLSITIFLLLILNLKTLPLAWHIRLLYRVLNNAHPKSKVIKTLQHHRTTKSSTHPLFSPVSITTRSPLLEIDYNIHKSNATFFTDLDESRTALVTKIYGPEWLNIGKILEKEDSLPKGKLSLILGAVHTSFHKEIKPYELYEITSKVLGWDRKWLIIISWFVRKTKKGKADVILASSLSKYVIKKGRITVSPERCLRISGWLNEHINDKENSDRGLRSREGRHTSKHISTTDEKTDGEAPSYEWDADRIENERLRGLRIAEHWMSLDQDLLSEFTSVPQ